VKRTTWVPAEAADLVAVTATRHAATASDDAFGDRFQTRPIADRHCQGPTRSTTLIALAAVIAAVIGALGYQFGDRHGALGEADGAVPDGVTVFDDGVPAVANLDSDLLGALRQAATDAEGDGVEFYVNSGWRSPEYQDQLLREAISEYGSEEEAARWVATADTSAHVSGDAIDIGHSDATAWLSKHGAEYGLCQIYRNEPWHYELRPDAINDGCPRRYADPTHDPRMQQ
jgi:D-alanyl-D-alanine carboxypeptidase